MSKEALLAEVDNLCRSFEEQDFNPAGLGGKIGAVYARWATLEKERTKPEKFPALGSLRYRVLMATTARWRLYQTGCTTEELESLLCRSHQSVSSAVHWSEWGGWLKDSGTRRQTRSKRDAVVWVPTAKMLEAASRLARAGA